MTIKNHINAGYPLICVDTFDDSAIITEVERMDPAPRVVVYSNATGALQQKTANGKTTQLIPWAGLVKQIAESESTICVVRDCNHILSNPPIYRAILDALPTLKSNGSALVLVAPSFGSLPAELIHVAPVIRTQLPTREQLASPLQTVATSASVELNGNRAALLDSAAGLTLDEAENAFALSLVESGELSPAIVQREKMRTLAATGFLSVENPRPMSDIGGLGQYKAYLQNEVIPLWADDQLRVRGVLFAGLGGTGKSLLCKATASALGIPLVRVDISGCKGSLLGQSETNIRLATKILEAVAPCVAWFDEIEKSTAGAESSGATDGGTTAGMLGHLLTWLQDHNSPIISLATCNNFKALPEAITRASRFDERFCVDLPTATERAAIAEVHLRRLRCEFAPELIASVVRSTDSYTGAEIEQLIKSAARHSARKPNAGTIAFAAESIKPLAVVNRQAVADFRQWSKATLRYANDLDTSENNKPARRVAAGAGALIDG